MTREAREELVEEQADHRSSGRKRIALPGRRTKRDDLRRQQQQGLHAACRRSAAAQLRARGRGRRLAMKGNGCAGSMASGVSTGKTSVQESARRATARPRPESSVGSITETPAGAQLVAQRAARSPAGRASACRRAVDRVELLRRGQPVLARRRDAGQHSGLSARRRAPCRTRRGCWPRSTGSAAARAADGADSRPRRARAR